MIAHCATVKSEGWGSRIEACSIVVVCCGPPGEEDSDGEGTTVRHPEFQVQAVQLVTEQGRSVAEVARDLDLSENLHPT